MQAYMEFVFFRFRRTDKMDSVMNGVIGQCPQNFWAGTAPVEKGRKLAVDNRVLMLKTFYFHHFHLDRGYM